MLYWESRRKMLISSAMPLIRKCTLAFRGLDIKVPFSSHLLKLALFSRSLPLFHNRPRASLVRFFFNDSLSL